MTAPLARRSFITGLISLVAAPAIVRAGSLMPVRVMVEAPFNESVLVTVPYIDGLFRLLTEHPHMTATQVIERINSVPQFWLDRS